MIRAGLPPFFASSLLLHAAVFVAWPAGETQPLAQPATLQLTLQTVEGKTWPDMTAYARAALVSSENSSAPESAPAWAEADSPIPTATASETAGADKAASDAREASLDTNSLQAATDSDMAATTAVATAATAVKDSMSGAVMSNGSASSSSEFDAETVGSMHSAATPDAPARAEESGAVLATVRPALSLAFSPDQLIQRLHDAAATYFYYPPLARRHGWEGEVRLALHVAHDGRLSDIRVLSSSGHRVLDRAAIDCLTRVARLPDATGVPPSGMETVLPVVYRLIDTPV